MAEYNRQVAVAIGAIGIGFLCVSYIWNLIAGKDSDQKQILEKLSKLESIEREIVKHEAMLTEILNRVTVLDSQTNHTSNVIPESILQPEEVVTATNYQNR